MKNLADLEDSACAKVSEYTILWFHPVVECWRISRSINTFQRMEENVLARQLSSQINCPLGDENIHLVDNGLVDGALASQQ